MSIEEKEKEKDKSIYNYNMIFNKIGNDNSEEDIKFNTDLISDLDLRNFDPKRYEYYTNLLKIYNEDPDTLFNLLNKYNSIKYTKEEEKKLIRQIYDYAVKYAKAKKADEDWEEARKIEEEARLAKAKAGTEALAKKTATGTVAAAAEELAKKTAMKGGEGGKGGKEGDGDNFRQVVRAAVAVQKVADRFKGNKEKIVSTTDIIETPIEKLINKLSEKLNGEYVPNPNEDDEASARYSETFTNNYKDEDENEKKTPEEKLKDNDEKNLNELKDTYKDTITPTVKEKEKKLDKATAKEKGLGATGAPQPPPQPPPTPTPTPTPPPSPPPIKQPVEDQLLTGAIDLDLIGNQPEEELPEPGPTPPAPPPPAEVSVADELLQKALELNLIGNQTATELPPTPAPAPTEINEDELLKQALSLSKKIFQNINGIENKEKTILDKAIDLLPDLLDKETPAPAPEPPVEESKLLNSAFGLLPGLLKKEAAAAAGAAGAEAAGAEAEAAAEAVKEDNKLLDETVELSKNLLVPNAAGTGAATGGGKKNLRGGAIDKYSDDILKMQYLDTKRYKNVKKEDLKDYRTQQKIRKYIIVPTETTNKIEQLSNEMDVYNDKIDKNNDDDKYIIQQIKNFENDPKNPIEELALTFDDRIVFIIATFFIRYITIIMVQWCIDINIIKTFYEGFIYYAIIYILIFWFIVLFVNIDNTYDVKYMNFNGVINSIRTIFYYFYMGTNGISRLLIHTSLIIILIIIPIILNIKGKVEFKDEDQSDAVVILVYEERKQLSKSLSLFTMFIWLFTSIIATKF